MDTETLAPGVTLAFLESTAYHNYGFYIIRVVELEDRMQNQYLSTEGKWYPSVGEDCLRGWFRTKEEAISMFERVSLPVEKPREPVEVTIFGIDTEDSHWENRQV